jgi:phospholipid transport system substrate-binding protein
MKSKKFLSLFIFLIILISSISNSYSITPEVFVQSTVNRASEALDSKYTKEEKIDKLKSIAKKTVDINGIGIYTLGAYRKGLKADERKEYSILFEQYFLKSFASRLAEYSNPEIQVNSSKLLNENYVMVNSTLVATAQRPEVKIDWRIYTKNPENLLIRDLIIEGLSLARTQKEEFASIIESNDRDINALFANFKKFINK